MSITTERPRIRDHRLRSDVVTRLAAAPAADDGIAEAACASARALGIPASAWTPECEGDAVPRMLMEVCERCPVWAACLREAVRMNDVGYRASTTTRQRRQMFPELSSSARGPVTEPRPVDLDQEVERRPRHPRGEGSLSRYRRGCRCEECRGHNAAARRRERARAS